MNIKKLSRRDCYQYLDPIVVEEVRRFHARTVYSLPIPSAKRALFPPVPADTLNRITNSETVFATSGGINVDLRAWRGCGSLQRARSAHRFCGESVAEWESFEQLLAQSFLATDPNDSPRPYPSGGALYPIEIVVAVFPNRVSGIECSGTYHLRCNSGRLEHIAPSGENELLRALTGGEADALGRPQFAIVYVMNIERALVKYRYRGYRLALLEAGSMYQQADLVGDTLGFRNRLWAGFSDYALCRVAAMDPRVLLPLVVQFFGQPS